jgi:hypothetical protein
MSLRCDIFYGEENHACTITILLNPMAIEDIFLKPIPGKSCSTSNRNFRISLSQEHLLK